VLSRWLSRLPELYEAKQVGLVELEDNLRDQLASAEAASRPDVAVRLAALHCIRFRFREAAKEYEDVLRRLPPGDPRTGAVRALLEDVRAILGSE
jgi:hypothetical protein